MSDLDWDKGVLANGVVISGALLVAYCLRLRERVSVRTKLSLPLLGSFDVNVAYCLACMCTAVTCASFEALQLGRTDTAVAMGDLGDQLLTLTYLVRSEQVFKRWPRARLLIRIMIMLAVFACGASLYIVSWEVDEGEGSGVEDDLVVALESLESLFFTSVLATYVVTQTLFLRTRGIREPRLVAHRLLSSRKVQASILLVVHEPVAILLTSLYGHELYVEALALVVMHVAVYVSESPSSSSSAAAAGHVRLGQPGGNNNSSSKVSSHSTPLSLRASRSFNQVMPAVTMVRVGPSVNTSRATSLSRSSAPGAVNSEVSSVPPPIEETGWRSGSSSEVHSPHSAEKGSQGRIQVEDLDGSLHSGRR